MDKTQKNADLIAALPTDSSLASSEEMELAKRILKKDLNLIAQIKESILVGVILFIILVLPIDGLLQKIPLLQSEYLRLVAKAILGMLIFLGIKIFYLK